MPHLHRPSIGSPSSGAPAPRRARSALLGAAAALLLAGCSSPIPQRDPTGETFPTVQGNRLTGEAITLPDDAVRDGPTLLVVGYVQEAQFDLDRWILGLLQGDFPHPFLEVAAARGFVPELISESIDEGMRRGIPDPDESSVVTVYDDADEVASFTGTVNPRNARVLLLDREGRVRFFHDAGYSARVLSELLDAAEGLAEGR